MRPCAAFRVEVLRQNAPPEDRVLTTPGCTPRHVNPAVSGGGEVQLPQRGRKTLLGGFLLPAVSALTHPRLPVLLHTPFPSRVVVRRLRGPQHAACTPAFRLKLHPRSRERWKGGHRPPRLPVGLPRPPPALSTRGALAQKQGGAPPYSVRSRLRQRSNPTRSSPTRGPRPSRRRTWPPRDPGGARGGVPPADPPFCRSALLLCTLPRQGFPDALPQHGPAPARQVPLPRSPVA
mmetsp:Transcript_32043/g.81590  ORF Transcript_32043/g.81590 Transcript_32043/m.81590 type:complete len:234 (+) Transcript_32043:454-1155(+)